MLRTVTFDDTQLKLLAGVPAVPDTKASGTHEVGLKAD